MQPPDQTDMDRQARDIFLRAVEIHSPEAQAAYLEGACQHDASLRSRVEALLENHRPDSFLESAAVDLAQTPRVDAPLTEGPGTKIGRYKLLQKIGEGGMGVVYMAEQEEPVRRRVALKIIKLGMDTRQVVARFEAERQALAMMDHPHIARVLDAGATESGRPYFVMELVQGVPITEYCDKAKLSAKERLRLFIQVCQAVQSAHQKGIIHRDLKPSNILVTLHHGEPMPKVIDFGIAKATNQKLTEKTLFTQHATMIGTPAYMSPEQAEMTSMDVDTRTDIYSLGVLLYELLTGSTPFPEKRLRSMGYGEMQRVIVDEEPERPSTRLSTLEGEHKTVVAKNRGEELAVLSKMLKGDLDWVVMRCLEKDRARRYETANGLAADIQRHLNSEPVVARPPSAAYRFQKAWKRNKVVFTAGLAVAAALTLGLLISVRQTLVATKAERGKSQALVAEKEQRIAAQAAQEEAEAARGQALAQALETRRRAYAADINLAQHKIDEGNLGYAIKLLDGHIPREPGEVDLRGWEWRYLRDLCKSEAIRTLCVLTNRSISALHTSGDGRWLAIRAGTDRVLIWDLLKDAPAEMFETPWFPRSTAFSPSSSLFACEWLMDATKDLRGVRLWDLKNRRMVGDIAATKENYVEVAFSPDEKRLMTVAYDGRVRCWRVPTGEEIALPWPEGLFDEAFRGPNAQISEGLELVAKARSGGFRVLDPRAGRELWAIGKESAGWVSSVAFSAGPRLLAATGSQATDPIMLWEAATGRFITNLVGHQGTAFSLKFGPGGEWIASASIDHTIKMWDLRDLPHVPPARVFRGHKQEVWALALLTDGRTLVSGAKDGEVCLWDTTSDARQRNHFKLSATDQKMRAWFAADGHSLTIFDKNRGELRDWDGLQTSVPRQLVGLQTPTQRVLGSHDGRWTATRGSNAIIQVWEASAGALAAEIQTASPNAFALQFDSKVGRLAAVDGTDLVVWDLKSKKKWASQPIPSGFENRTSANLALASDLAWAVVQEDRQTPDERGEPCFIVDMNTGRKRPLGHIYGANDVSISPGDDLVAIPSVDGNVRIWRSTNCDEVATLRGFRNAAVRVAFSPDGMRLAVGTGGDGLVTIWDVATWRELVELRTGGEWVFDLQFSPDGSALRAVDERAFHLWRAPSWEEIGQTQSAGGKPQTRGL